MRLVAAAVAFFLPATALAQNATLVLRPGETLLEVDAQGVHRQRPDVMTIGAGVVTTGSTAAGALEANSAVAERLIAAVRARGIEARDVRTTELRIRPRFAPQRSNADDADEEDRPITGYIATNRLEIRLRTLGRAPELLDALLQAGANSVQGPRFSLSDDRPAVLAAQADAVRRAREEAGAYAAAAGMRVGRMLRMSERGRTLGGQEYIVVTGSRTTAGPPIEPGELDTTVRLWVDFALEPN